MLVLACAIIWSFMRRLLGIHPRALRSVPSVNADAQRVGAARPPQPITLTRFVCEREVATLLNRNFTNPVHRTGATLIVKPAPIGSANLGVVGTAYDYWFRLALLGGGPSVYEAFIGYRQCSTFHGRERRILKRFLEHINHLHGPPLGQWLFNRATLESCLFLASFEAEFRSGYPPATLNVEGAHVDELRRVCDATDFHLFDTSTVVPNPEFGVRGTRLRVAADGDVILGATLVDLKTAGKMSLEPNWRQLIGYWALNSLRPERHAFAHLGLYYPRFNYYVDRPINDLMTATQQATVLGYFRGRVGL